MLAIAVPPAGTAEGAVVALASFVEEHRVHAALDAGYLLKDLDRDLLDRRGQSTLAVRGAWNRRDA